MLDFGSCGLDIVVEVQKIFQIEFDSVYVTFCLDKLLVLAELFPSSPKLTHPVEAGLAFEIVWQVLVPHVEFHLIVEQIILLGLNFLELLLIV